MSKHVVIQTDGLGKRYRRGLRPASETLREALTSFMRSPRIFLRRPRQTQFWALEGVTLQVMDGEVLGLIGGNGAGKTTLLKILSRITRPTTGWAKIHGRVRSLLEVGTGFHPELSGRQNTYLSGSILGMRKREIDRKFDEIVAFADIDKFIDTPVKHYSSGMYVRLAFAVAAHLEPEILLVDEVLAVGDITFQKKCLGKMGDVARQGRTIVLVSHNMAAISSLCSRCLLLEQGRITFDGPTATALTRYYAKSMKVGSRGDTLRDRSRQGNGKARFSSIAVKAQSADGEALEFAYPGCDLSVEIEVECQTSFADCILAAVFYDSTGYRLIDTNTAQKGQFVSLDAGQKAKSRFLLRQVLLRPGQYYIGLWLGRHGMEVLDDVEHAVTLDVVESEETSQHSVIYPGAYLCRFENTFNVF